MRYERSRVYVWSMTSFLLVLIPLFSEASSCDIVNQDAVASAMDYVETYAPDAYKNLLFISDGIDFTKRDEVGEVVRPKNWFLRWLSNLASGMSSKSLGEQVAETYRDKYVVRTDLLVEPAEFDNQRVVRADNTEPFPKEITNTKYDFIVMRDGMCVCCAAHACGGLSYERGVMGTFLKQVSSLLNTENPEAIAVLHARAGRVNSAQLKILEAAAADAKKEFPGLRYSINLVNGGRFHSLMIRPANAPTLSVAVEP